MAKLLIDWLNNEVKLSQQIVSLDHDFVDGYLIGELLHKYNQQYNFDQFVANGTSDAKIRNFCLLEPTMRQIGVHYNSRIAQDIMNAKPAVMKTLLYEIRTTLDIISKRNQSVKTDDMDEVDRKKILCVIQPSRPLYDKTMSITFENAVRAMMENPNDVMMAEATKRFRERKQQMRMNASMGMSEQLDAAQLDLQRRKQMDRQRRKHEMEFQEAWDMKNREQWQKNQAVARDRREVEQKVFNKERSEKVARFENLQKSTRELTLKSIDDFETKLSTSMFHDDASSNPAGGETTKGGTNCSMLKTIGGQPGTGIPEVTYLDQAVLNQNLVHAQKTIKEHHIEVMQQQQLHGRRRRKFVRETESVRTKRLQKVVEEEMVSQILLPCNSELLEKAEFERVNKHIHMIRDNGENRQVLLLSGLEADAYRDAKWKEQEVHHELNWIISQRMSSQYLRSDRCEEAMAAAIRFDALDIMKSEVDRILELADWVIAARAFGVFTNDSNCKVEESESVDASTSRPNTGATNTSTYGGVVGTVTTTTLPEPMWKVVKQMYCSKFPLSEALPLPSSSYIYETLPNSLSLQPQCIDIGSSLTTPFDGKCLFTAKEDVSVEKNFRISAAASQMLLDETNKEEEIDAVVNDSTVVVKGLPDSQLFDYLSYADAHELLESLLNAESLGGTELVNMPSGLLKTKEEAAAAPASTEEDPTKKVPKIICVPPDTIFKTPSKYLLGEILLDVSCTHDPLPEDPEPEVTMDLTSMPIKLALAGPCELGKNAIANTLRDRLGVRIINCELLIHEGLVEYDRLKKAREQRAMDKEKLVKEEGCVDAEITVSNDEKSLVLRSNSASDEGSDGQDQLKDEEHLFAKLDQLNKFLASGQPVSDELYVYLIVNAINQLQQELSQVKALEDEDLDADFIAPVNCPGFVVEDFPNTEKQALLLFQALSGYDYAKSRPQPVDRASKYAPPAPCKRVDYDVSKCGLDAVYYVDACSADASVTGSSMDTLINERVGARINIAAGGEQIYLDDNVKSMDGLVEPYDPLHCVHTCGIDISITQQTAPKLKEFLTSMNLLKTSTVNDISKVYEFANVVVTDLATNTPGVQIENNVLELNEQNGEIVAEEENPEGPISPPSTPPEGVETATPEIKVVDIVESTKLPKQLADALAALWKTAEDASDASGCSFAMALRETKFQILQRRRGMHDVVFAMLSRLDEKQSLLEDFRKDFNEVELDFRFDPDCQKELHLRTLELRNKYWDLCEKRKFAVEDYLLSMQHDANIGVMMLRSHAEAAAMIQSEMNRFLGAIHILLDYSKAVGGYSASDKREWNELEDAVSLDDGKPKSASGGGGKKGKGAAAATPAAYRTPVASVVLPSSVVMQIPQPTTPPDRNAVEAPIPTGKGSKAKPAKGKDAAAADGLKENPFDIAYQAAVDASAVYMEGTFKLNRELYGNDEALCIAIENAVWFETRKLQQSIDNVKQKVTEQVALINQLECDIQCRLKNAINEQHMIELSVCERVISMIQEHILNCEAISTEWLIAKDAMAVCNDRVVYMPPEVDMNYCR